MSNIQHTKNYLIGSIATKALGFISIPFFTHYLSVKEYGIMSLYTTILSFLTTTLGLGVLGSFKRYYFEKDNDFGAFLFSNLIFLFFYIFLITSIYFYFLQDISTYLNIPISVMQYAIFVAILLLIIRIKLDFLQIREKSKKNVLFEFIQTALSIVFSVGFILILSNDKYMGKIYGDLIALGLLAIYSIYKLSKIIQFKFYTKYIKYALTFGLPVLPSMYASFGLAFADRLMINSMTNTSDVGLYSFGFTIAMLVQVVVLSIGKSWQPLFYKSLAKKDYKILDNTFLLNAKIVFTFSLMIIFFIHELIYILATKAYLESENIILYLVFGFNFFFLYSIYGQYTSYAKKTYWDSIITLSSVVINIGLNYWLIPIYGFVVSAITTIISYMWMFGSFYIVSKYILKFRVINISLVYKVIVYYLIFIAIFLLFKVENISYIWMLIIKLFLMVIFIFILFIIIYI